MMALGTITLLYLSSRRKANDTAISPARHEELVAYLSQNLMTHPGEMRERPNGANAGLSAAQCATGSFSCLSKHNTTSQLRLQRALSTVSATPPLFLPSPLPGQPQESASSGDKDPGELPV